MASAFITGRLGNRARTVREYSATSTTLEEVRTVDGILKYIERGDNLLQWWAKQVNLPLLSALANSYLSIPATRVISESFSVFSFSP